MGNINLRKNFSEKKKPLTLENVSNIFCTLYLCYIAFAFLLGYHNNYIDITATKRVLFLVGATVFCGIMFCIWPAWVIWRTKSHILQWTDVPLFLLILSWIIGLFFCDNPAQSFWGTEFKCTGLLMYLLGLSSIYFLGKFLRPSVLLKAAFLISTNIICGLQVLNRFKIDPLNMYHNILYYLKPQFISTLGNTNYNGAYDALIIGIIMVLFYTCKSFKGMFAYLCTLTIAYAGAICTVSDVVFICIAVTFLILFGHACLHPGKWWKILVIYASFLTSCAALSQYYHQNAPDLFIWGMTATIFEGTYFSYGIYLLVGSILLLLILYRFLGTHRNGMFLFYRFVVLTATCIGSSILLFANSTLYAAEKFGLIDSLVIDGSWGNDRGDIWMRCLTAFVHAPIQNKLFGFGFNNVFNALETVGLGVREEETIADAHNIFLNTLITSGILGCIFWAIFIIMLILKTRKLLKTDSTNALLVLVGICTLFAQGLVIGSQIITTPIILTELGIFYGLLRYDKQQLIDSKTETTS